MKLQKKILNIFYLLFFTILTNCVQSSVSLFGPALTGVKTGNVYQSGLSYVSSGMIKEQLGTTPTQYVKKIINQYSSIEKNIDKKSTLIQSENLEFKQDYKDAKDDYSNFIIAVKKMLK